MARQFDFATSVINHSLMSQFACRRDPVHGPIDAGLAEPPHQSIEKAGLNVGAIEVLFCVMRLAIAASFGSIPFAYIYMGARPGLCRASQPNKYLRSPPRKRTFITAIGMSGGLARGANPLSGLWPLEPAHIVVLAFCCV